MFGKSSKQAKQVAQQINFGMTEAEAQKMREQLFIPPVNAMGPTVELYEVPAATNMDRINPMTATALPGGDPVAAVNPVSQLNRYRQQFPFIPVMQLPQYSKTVLLPSISNGERSQFIAFPENSTFVELIANAPFYISFNGLITMPTVIGDPGLQLDMFYMPERRLYYIEGRSGIDAIAVTPNTYLSILGYGAPAF